MKNENFDKIIVIDFGSQYNQLIVRRIREFNVYSELVPNEITAKEIKEKGNIKGIVLSGGPHSVYDDDAFRIDKEIFNLGVPVLGICYGMQYLAYNNDGEVLSSEKKEYGKQEITCEDSLLFKNTPKNQNVWMSHGDKVTKLPNGFKCVASSKSTLICAMENEKAKVMFDKIVNCLKNKYDPNQIQTLPYKDGALKPAYWAEKDIIFAVHYGTDKVLKKMPKGFKKRNITFEFHQPIKYQDIKNKTTTTVMPLIEKISNDTLKRIAEQNSSRNLK